jgi:integrase/recombinase XerC
MAVKPTDRRLPRALEPASPHATDREDPRPAIELLARSLLELGARTAPPVHLGLRLARDRDAWLRRLQSAQRSASTVSAYRIAIDDLLAWAAREERTHELFEEHAIVEYLSDYRRRNGPAPATYHRRFLLLRRFMHWSSARNGLPDPFLELDTPAKPRHEGDWLTRSEFAQLLHGAGAPKRRRPGLVERDRLVLLTLATTGLRRSELIGLDWRDVALEPPRPSLLIRCAKGGRPRRQPLPRQLAGRLERLRAERGASPSDPVFCGLEGARLQPTILAGIIARAASAAGLEKHITEHTLRHTAATWLRQATGDTRLVAEYLGHADLSTVSHYAHVPDGELHDAAQLLADGVQTERSSPPLPAPRTGVRRGRIHPGQLSAWD